MDSLKVAVRMRPLLSKENALKTRWNINGSSISLDGQDDLTFTFDHIFDEAASNEHVYQELASDIVKKAMEGYNGTVFCYGQSGSGKTFTTDELRRLALKEILDYIENCPQREFLLRVSYFEIYNEKISDLLGENKELTLREDMDKNVILENLQEEFIKTSGQVFELLAQGNERRRISETKLNSRSSRSHCIFRIVVESRMRGSEENLDISGVLVANLYLVDLAGSERASANTGDRFREGVNINKSLLTLSLVIRQLSEDSNQHISYRDSKLTRILQNALGGNSKTAILCTVSPGSIDESISTLRFGQSAKRVKNKPLLNEVVTDKALLKRHQKEIAVLKATIKKLESEQSQHSKEEMEALRLKQKDMLEMYSSRLCVSSNVTGKSFKTRRQTVCVTQISRRQGVMGVPRFSPIKLPILEVEEVEIPLPTGPERVLDHLLDSPCSKSDCMCRDLSFQDYEKELVTESAIQEYKRQIDLLVKENLSLKQKLPSLDLAVSPDCDASDIFPAAIDWNLSKNVSTVWDLSKDNVLKEMDSESQKAKPETGISNHLESGAEELKILNERYQMEFEGMKEEFNEKLQLTYNELDDLTEQNKDLRNMIEKEKSMLATKDQEITEANKRAKEAEEMCSNLQTEKAELDAKFASRLDTDRGINTELDYLCKENEKFKLENEELKLQQEELNIEYEKFKKDHEMLKEELYEKLQLTYDELDDLTEQNEELRNMIEMGKTMLTTKDQEISEANKRAMEAEEMCCNLHTEKAELETQLVSQLDTDRGVNTELDHLCKENEKLKLENEKLKLEQEELNLKYEKFKKDNEILKEELNEKLQLTYNELDDLTEQNEDLRNMIEKEKSMLATKDLEITEANKRAKEAEIMCSNLQTEKAELEAQLASRLDTDRGINTELDHLCKENEKLKLENEKLKLEQDELNLKYEKFKKDNEILKEEFNEKLQLTYNELDDLTEQNEDLTNMIEMGKSMLASKDQEITETKKRAKEAEIMCSNLQTEKAELEAQLASQLDTDRGVSTELDHLCKENEKLKLENEKLKLEQEELNLKYKKFKKDNEILKNLENELLQKINEISEENVDLRVIIEKGKALLAQQDQEINEAKSAQSQNAQLEAKMTSQLGEFLQLEIENDSLRKEVSKLQKEFEKEINYYKDTIKKQQIALREKGNESFVAPKMTESMFESLRTRFMIENAEKFEKLKELQKTTMEQAETITKLKELCSQLSDKENTPGPGKLDVNRVRPHGIPVLKERQMTSNIVVAPSEQEKSLRENPKLQETEMCKTCQKQKTQLEAEMTSQLGEARQLEIEINTLKKENATIQKEFEKEINYYKDTIKKQQIALREKGNESFVQPKMTELTLESLRTRFMIENAEKFEELKTLQKTTMEQAETITKLKELCRQLSDKENTQGAGKQEKFEQDMNRVRPLGVLVQKEHQITSNVVVPSEKEKWLQEENLKLQKEIRNLQTECQQAQLGFSGGIAETLMVRQYAKQLERMNRKNAELKEEIRKLQLNIQQASK